MSLSEFIRANLEAILRQWAQPVAAGSLPVERKRKRALRRHARGVLHAMADELDRPSALHGRPPPVAKSPAGKDRRALPGILSGLSARETVAEIRDLRGSVLRLWMDANPAATAAGDELIRFNEALDETLAESITRYAFDKGQYLHLFDSLLATSPDLSYLIDLQGRFIFANRSFRELTGESEKRIVGAQLLELATPVAPELHRQFIEVLATQQPSRIEISLTTSAGEKLIYENLLVCVRNEAGHPEAVAGTARDVTERKQEEDKALRSANYDFLTGLPNRKFLRERLELEIRRFGRTNMPIALFFIDLDGFKEVNDRLGHDAGDKLLQQVAQRISASVRATDMVARLGGDEFSVLLTEVNHLQHVEILAEEMIEELAKPYSIIETDVHISGSIGIALLPDDAASAEDLIRNADQAMYVAKSAGRNRFSFFTAAMRESAWARLKVIEELRNALPQEQFSVHYQPIVDLSAERIVKAEALLRWYHPQAGFIQPDTFIGLAEEIGLIGDLDDWVLREAIECARQWSILLARPFQISVNKSPLDFMNKVPTRSWHSNLEALGLAWNSISVEITEGVLLRDMAPVAERLASLQQAGVQLSIDDFGSGHSSMSYLKKFDVDYLKIDRSFVQDTPTSRDSRIIAEAIIVMAHKLGLKVIAEGVETVEQSRWLKDAGCDYGQGYYFSAPLPAPEFASLLQAGKGQLAAPRLPH